MKLTPLGKYVLVRPTTAEERSDGGILIPDKLDLDKLVRGTVIGIGDSCELDLAEGDKVVFIYYKRNEVRIDDIVYVMVNEEDVYGVIRNK